jgi:hypothetical protein
MNNIGSINIQLRLSMIDSQGFKTLPPNTLIN